MRHRKRSTRVHVSNRIWMSIHMDMCWPLNTKLVLKLQPENQLFLERGHPQFAPDKPWSGFSSNFPACLSGSTSSDVCAPPGGTTGAQCKVKNLRWVWVIEIERNKTCSLPAPSGVSTLSQISLWLSLQSCLWQASDHQLSSQSLTRSVCPCWPLPHQAQDWRVRRSKRTSFTTAFGVVNEAAGQYIFLASYQYLTILNKTSSWLRDWIPNKVYTWAGELLVTWGSGPLCVAPTVPFLFNKFLMYQ